MPIYSYKCEKCGRIFDKFQKASDGNGNNSNTKCIYCNSNAKRLFLPAGIIFKGSGFYKTDYRSNSVRSGSNLPEGKGLKKSESSPNKSEGKAPDSKKIDNKKADREKPGKESSAVLDKTTRS